MNTKENSVKDIYSFEKPEKQQLFHKITHELRCGTCQNQALMDSNAPLAINIRQEIYQQVQNGRSEQEILSFVTHHYGNTILYSPPLQWGTSLLWFGPFLIFILGFFIFKKYLRSTDNKC